MSSNLFLGVGTAYWTGIFLRDVINEFAGGLKPEALHVCMDGNDNTAKVIFSKKKNEP